MILYLEYDNVLFRKLLEEKIKIRVLDLESVKILLLFYIQNMTIRSYYEEGWYFRLQIPAFHRGL